MQRYFMHLSYNGTPYHGWQIQPGVVTVQQVLEQALATVLRTPTPVTGAGRTDTGVNARLMTAHFDTPGDGLAMPPQALVKALNSIVGKDIAVHSIEPVSADMHARFSATSRTYRYYAVTSKSPFLYPHSWLAPATLDFEAMNRAAAHLLTASDFTSFAKLHAQTRTNLCRVTHAQWHPTEIMGQPAWMFVITADRFLRNMVRAVVGTLVEVGRGRLTPDGFAQVIARRDRCAAGTSMPPQALYLWDITYPVK